VRRPAVALVVAGVGLGVAAEFSLYLPDSPGLAAGDFAVGFAFIGAGALALRRSTATGALMAATGVAWFLGGLVGGLVFLHRGPLVHLLLTYPRGRLESRLDRVVVAAAYFDGLVYALGRSNVVTLLLVAAVLAAAIVRYAGPGGAERRARGSALAVTGGVVAVLATAAVARLTEAEADSSLLWAYEAVLVVGAAGLCADLLWARWTQAAVTGLVIDLGDLWSEATLRARLARSVGDPALVLGYWDEGRSAYVDESGQVIALPQPHGDRAVLLVSGKAGGPAAAIVHDPAVLDEPELAEAVTAAVRIAVSNLDLQAQVRAKVEQVRASRRRLVEAADAERRRLERELREMAEPRLQAIAGLLDHSGPETGDARRELDAVQDELGTLARGIHPRILTESGVAAALEELSARLPLPVGIEAHGGALPPAVAAAAYFVCSEGLANAAKHAGATHLSLVAKRRNHTLVVEVSDDGAGGADLAGGSGLQGLIDRVEALGGALLVDSAPGAGTVLRAEIPIDRDAPVDEAAKAGAVG
jgi:signal transduction histidine kinase